MPPSPEKVNPSPSPRLFLKLQHKKSSSSSSSTTEEQQRVAEWNVLTMDSGGCEVTSESDASGARPAFDRQQASLPSQQQQSGSRPRPDDGWSRIVQPGSGVRQNRGGPGDGDGCPDSTSVPPGGSAASVASVTTVHPLQRTATEPFSPRGVGVDSSDNAEDHSEVFPVNSSGQHNKTSSALSSGSCSSSVTSSNRHSVLPSSSMLSSSAPSNSSSFLPLQHHKPQTYQSFYHQNAHQQHPHNIPPQTVPYQPGRQGHKPTSQTQQSSSSSNVGSDKSVVSSSFPSSSTISSSHHVSNSGATSCQFSYVSSSSVPVAKSSSSSSLPSSSVVASGLPSSQHPVNPLPFQQHHHINNTVSSNSPSSSSSLSTPAPHNPESRNLTSTLPFHPFSGRGGKSGGGSIVTGLSDRAVAASSSSSTPASPLATTQPAASAPNPSPLTSVQHLPRLDSSVRPVVPRVDELSSVNKSDTSSCDSPLHVEPEDSNPATSEQGSRPSTPKVPPLKIRLGVQSAVDSKVQAKSGLPYVVNPSWDGGEDGQKGISSTAELGDLAAHQFTMSPRNSPHTNSGAGMSNDREDSNSNMGRNVDTEETCSQESDSRAEQSDGGAGKDGEESQDGAAGKEKRPTRTLRSHTAKQAQGPKDKETPKNSEQTAKGSDKNGNDEFAYLV